MLGELKLGDAVVIDGEFIDERWRGKEFPMNDGYIEYSRIHRNQHGAEVTIEFAASSPLSKSIRLRPTLEKGWTPELEARLQAEKCTT